MVRFLLDNDARVNGRSRNYALPLCVAVKKRNPLIARLLLMAGASVHKFDTHGTPLHYAAASGDWQSLPLLLQAGADLEKPAARGFMPLHSAAYAGRQRTTRLLLEAGLILRFLF